VLWDPDRYLRFADHRTRPGLELLARIPDIGPRTIVDLGCGTGTLTAHLARRWPGAQVVGIDSSEEMIDRARAEHPGLIWSLGDISAWEPNERIDLIFSNAALHWLDDHESLVPRIRSHVAPGGAVALQMPDNWNAPTHQIPTDILDDGTWPDVAREALMRDRLADPEDYARWLGPATIDMWRTTYWQVLEGDDPVWSWVTGSLLRPVLAVLDEDDRERFSTECRARYAETYRPAADGTVTAEFSRLFVIADVH
jgi:trans-aconitate 2-methyltransferase